MLRLRGRLTLRRPFQAQHWQQAEKGEPAPPSPGLCCTDSTPPPRAPLPHRPARRRPGRGCRRCRPRPARRQRAGASRGRTRKRARRRLWAGPVLSAGRGAGPGAGAAGGGERGGPEAELGRGVSRAAWRRRGCSVEGRGERGKRVRRGAVNLRAGSACVRRAGEEPFGSWGGCRAARGRATRPFVTGRPQGQQLGAAGLLRPAGKAQLKVQAYIYLMYLFSRMMCVTVSCTGCCFTALMPGHVSDPREPISAFPAQAAWAL